MAQPTSAARPKRPGEDFTRQTSPSSKKPRFDYRNPSTLAADAPEDDPILDADVIGRSGAQIKRNAVNIDGYESDSDNDNFNSRAAEREKKQKQSPNGHGATKEKSADEEEDDMFADLDESMQGTKDGDEDEELAAEGKRTKRDVRFLDVQNDIEGVDMNSKSGGHVSADLLVNQKRERGKGKQRRASATSSSSSSGDEEEQDRLPDEMEDELAAEIGAGGKKKHAPRLDAFNLKQEEEDGRFDESHNYVRKAADPDAANDNWLDGLSRKDMKKARAAQEKRDEDRRKAAREADATLTSDLLGRLISRLETGESALEALQRLGRRDSGKKKAVPKWKQKRLDKHKMDLDSDGAAAEGVQNGEEDGAAEKSRQDAIEAITGAADALYSRQQLDIYNVEREILMRQYKREAGEDWLELAPEVAARNGVPEQAQRHGDAAAFVYRWSDKRDGGEHHGPFDRPTMKAWDEAGYFGEGVEFREIGQSVWSRKLDI